METVADMEATSPDLTTRSGINVLYCDSIPRRKNPGYYFTLMPASSSAVMSCSGTSRKRRPQQIKEPDRPAKDCVPEHLADGFESAKRAVIAN